MVINEFKKVWQAYIGFLKNLVFCPAQSIFVFMQAYVKHTQWWWAKNLNGVG
jgi:hypothetical protein